MPTTATRVAWDGAGAPGAAPVSNARAGDDRGRVGAVPAGQEIDLVRARFVLDNIAIQLYSHTAMDNATRLSRVFSALSDPTRRAILARLARGDATVSELAEPFDMAQPTISRHLTVLEEAGLIRTAKDAQRRPRSLVVGGPLEDADAWLAPFRAQWERRFDRLESFLESRTKPSNEKPKKKVTR